MRKNIADIICECYVNVRFRVSVTSAFYPWPPTPRLTTSVGMITLLVQSAVTVHWSERSLLRRVTGLSGMEFDTQSIVAWICQLVQLFRQNWNGDRHIFRLLLCNCDNIKLFKRLRGQRLFETRRLIEVLWYKESLNWSPKNRAPTLQPSQHYWFIRPCFGSVTFWTSDL